eukprot:CAMPEP_0184299974 /NCGR_PEP_ID=MMETSP1049-20130417/10484_1 /TAXON_ID=77928 /ORGANISM="Proteomonas sulcata, Strain CCMP704" /LENGTH=377 /DNA_ID=CAMNT_0026610565 /DNA_START=1 /DNA_END=1134 /DNA_ORIENTATION=+
MQQILEPQPREVLTKHARALGECMRLWPAKFLNTNCLDRLHKWLTDKDVSVQLSALKAFKYWFSRGFLALPDTETEQMLRNFCVEAIDTLSQICHEKDTHLAKRGLDACLLLHENDLLPQEQCLRFRALLSRPDMQEATAEFFKRVFLTSRIDEGIMKTHAAAREGMCRHTAAFACLETPDSWESIIRVKALADLLSKLTCGHEKSKHCVAEAIMSASDRNAEIMRDWPFILTCLMLKGALYCVPDFDMIADHGDGCPCDDEEDKQIAFERNLADMFIFSVLHGERQSVFLPTNGGHVAPHDVEMMGSGMRVLTWLCTKWDQTDKALMCTSFAELVRPAVSQAFKALNPVPLPTEGESFWESLATLLQERFATLGLR